MIKNLKNKIRFNLKNIPGWKCNRKIVVFESDDWGSNRIASKAHFENLQKAGFPVHKSAYNRFDTIERSEDLEELFNVLTSVKDKNGRNAVFTPFLNVANPDYDKIRKDNFESYHYETFYETLERYGEKNAVKELYSQGISKGIFQPEFHGREHISIPLWMRLLREGNEKVLSAFEHQFTSVSVEGLDPLLSGFRPTFYFESPEDLTFLKNSIKEGTGLFEELIGYKAGVFDPPNGIFHEELENDINEAGIKTIVVNRFRMEPNGTGGFNKKYFSFGSENEYGQTYYIRNCQFEPYDGRSEDHCLMMMQAAFNWKKPAIICSHRVNFNGGIDPENRKKGLLKLKNLLSKMLNRWPDIEFMSSGEFASVLKESQTDR